MAAEGLSVSVPAFKGEPKGVTPVDKGRFECASFKDWDPRQVFPLSKKRAAESDFPVRGTHPL